MKGIIVFALAILIVLNGNTQTGTANNPPYALIDSGSKGIGYAIPGMLSKITSVLVRVLPRKWVVSLYNKVGK